MIKILLTIALVFGIVRISNANPIDDKLPNIVNGNAPIISDTLNKVYLIKSNYAILYNIQTKTPVYVVEHPKINDIEGLTKRSNNFRADRSLSLKNRSQLGDYTPFSKIYDKGHLVPADDSRQSDKIMRESFLLSNIVPQNIGNNRGIWKCAEDMVRKNINEGGDVFIISGTIYLPGYKTIGINKVGVPDYLYKIIYNKKTGRCIIFKFPNKNLPKSELMKDTTSISELEKITGIKYFPSLK